MNRTDEDKLELENALAFTDLYRENADQPSALRELNCLEFQFRSMFLPPEADDFFAGRVRYPLCGFSPQPQGFGYYCREDLIHEKLKSVTDETFRSRVGRMLDFWRTENSRCKTREAYSPGVAGLLFTDDMKKIAPAYPLYRISGTQLDYGKLLKFGVNGLKELVYDSFPEDSALGNGLNGALDLLSDIALRYVRMLRKTALVHDRDAMIAALEYIPRRPPQTFREALQLFWLASVAAGSWNYGRMDVVFGEFLRNDLESGRLTKESAEELLGDIWKLMHLPPCLQWDERVIVGGKGRPDEDAADLFAFLAIEVARKTRYPFPQLTLRFYPGQNPELMDKAVQALADGVTFPLLYNDEANIPAAARAMNIPESEAVDYLPFGCGEYMIWKRSIATPSGAINLGKCLELALHDGKCAITGKQIGQKTGDPAEFHCFEDLWNAYRGQVEPLVEALACQERIEYEVMNANASFLYFTLLSDDCLARGRAFLDGGVRYLAGTLETYGNIDVADALCAIQKAVYEQKKFSLCELIRMLDRNWEGFERERNAMLAFPKYGNDDAEADAMAVRVHEHICDFIRKQARKNHLAYYLAVLINNSMNVDFGRMTSALPDGRFSGEPLANGNNPVAGRDRSGVTAFLNSLLKLRSDLHAGAVQNMKFSRTMIKRNFTQWRQLLASYFSRGGAQAMITVVNRGDLESAMKEPEKWGNLMVRVGGFSARFVDLSRDIQLHILRRTLNE